MDLRAINEVLLTLLEQVDDVDLNDLGAFGMDAMSRKRLRVKRLHVKGKKKVRRPVKTSMPFSLRNIGSGLHGDK